MKTSSLHWVATLAFVLVTSSATATFAQTSTTPAPAAEKHHGFGAGVLTPAEQKQLETDRQKVLAADPALKTEGESLKEKGKTARAGTAEDKKAFREELKAHMAKLNAAVVKLDPSAAPLIAKVQAARHHNKD